MKDSVLMAELTWPEYAAKVADGAPVFLPLGATEQHGPHMALSVDVLLASAVAERVAREVGGVVAPAIPYGYKSQPRSGGGESFPGTTSLRSQTLALVVRDILVGLARDGVRRVVIMCGHFENVWPAIEGIDLGLEDIRREGIEGMTVLRLEYWDFVARETLDRLFPDGFPGTELEHAALLETSAMLVVRPDLVDLGRVPSDGPARVPSYDRYPVPAGYIPPSGVLARAERASAEYGRLLFDDYVPRVAAAVREGLSL
jgi:creatinine amidohydrolase